MLEADDAIALNCFRPPREIGVGVRELQLTGGRFMQQIADWDQCIAVFSPAQLLLDAVVEAHLLRVEAEPLTVPHRTLVVGNGALLTGVEPYSRAAVAKGWQALLQGIVRTRHDTILSSLRNREVASESARRGSHHTELSALKRSPRFDSSE